MAKSSVSSSGVSFALGLAQLMDHPTFHQSMLPHLSSAQRCRLYALRQQVLVGDAPTDDAAMTSSSSMASRWRRFGHHTRWMTYWSSLRGTMSHPIACEAFVADFLALMDSYSLLPMVPLVESVLSAAQRTATSTPPQRISPGHGRAGQGAGEVVRLRALHGDPAAMALVWVCRAYSIPCELTVEPLPEASHDSFTNFWPVEVSIFRDGVALTTVDDPLAAFTLLCDAFLSHMPSWEGGRSPLGPKRPASSSVVASLAPPSILRASQRSGWIQELQDITMWLRSPLLQLMVNHAAGEREERRILAGEACQPTSTDVAARVARREALLNATIQHFRRYEHAFLRLQLRRREAAVAPTSSARPPLLESSAVAQLLEQSFGHRLVSFADVYTACCAYVLVTHPGTQDLCDRWSSEDSTPSRTPGQAWQLHGSFYNHHQPTSSAGATSAPRDLLRHSADVSGALHDGAASVRAEGRITPDTTIGSPQDVDGPHSAKATSAVLTTSARSPTTAAAEVVQAMLLSKLGSPTARADLPVLGLLLQGAWAITQAQCVGFPYLRLLEKRRLAFMEEVVLQPTSTQKSVGLRDPSPSLPSVGSWQSWMEEAWNTLTRITARSLAPPEPSPTAASVEHGPGAADRVRVFRHDVPDLHASKL